MATTTGKGEGKSVFVRDLLQRNSNATEKTVNEAWKTAGNEGTISGTLVYKIRKDLGMAGKGTSTNEADVDEATFERSKPRSSPKESKGQWTDKPVEAAPAGGKGLGTTPETFKSEPIGSESEHTEGRDRVLDEVEDGIDDLIFKLKESGGKPEVEEALRRVRRLLYHSHP